VFTLLEISSWAFLFAWRLESAILDKSGQDGCHPPLYQVVDPGLAFIPRVSLSFFLFRIAQEYSFLSELDLYTHPCDKVVYNTT
jgi:hypothetical protein